MKTNIVLIGMTGSGKTSIGELLSQQLTLPFRDMDLFIEQITLQSIPELFEVSEAHFRAIETKACKTLAAKETHTVISCGGGVVLQPENIQALSETGWIVFIDRPVEHIIEDIIIGHRPLLKEGVNKLYQLYEERIDLYRSAADFRVENQTTLDDVLNQIKEQLPETIASVWKEGSKK
ncbi:shikimate kinase [Mycobacteroides abscessus]|uniref:shikimate kinase n=1 Tax=unclassified Desemzia TaxID=2685243 RepID=UPI0009A59792|nr:shikimate kinase [Mycobacteroides abscessus subsp. abscessus]